MVVFRGIVFSILVLLCGIIYPLNAAPLSCDPKVEHEDRGNHSAIASFIQAWGVLKYFHHENLNKEAWDRLFLENIPKFIQIKSGEEARETLESFLSNFPYRNTKPTRFWKQVNDTLNISCLDVADIVDTGFADQSIRQILQTYIRTYKPGVRRQFEDEVSPFSMGKHQFSKSLPPPPDKENALLQLAIFWNAIQYYYPYKLLLDTSWKNMLLAYIPRFLERAGSSSYYLLFAELRCELKDCHAVYTDNNVEHIIGAYRHPIHVQFIAGKTIVSRIADFLMRKSGIHVGYEVLGINGINIRTVRDSLGKLFGYCGHDQVNHHQVDQQIFRSGLKDTVLVTYVDLNRDTGQAKLNYDLNTADSLFSYYSRSNERTESIILSDSIGYIDMNGIKKGPFRQAFRQFRKLPYMILDIRNYPGVNAYDVGIRYSNQNKPIAKLYESKPELPGLFQPQTVKTDYIGRRFFVRKYKGQLVVLIDEKTISAAELTVMALKANSNAVFIGRNTAGANGRMVKVKVSEVSTIYFTNQKVMMPDGTLYHGIGIAPDVYVRNSVEQLIKGRDSVLEKAVSLIQNNSLRQP